MPITWEHAPLLLVFTLLVLEALVVVGIFFLIIEHCRRRRLHKADQQLIIDSSLEDLEKCIQVLEKVESDLAERMGMCRKDFDSDALRLMVKQEASSNRFYSRDLEDLGMLHHKRLNRSRILGKKVPVKPVPRSLPPGPPFSVDASRFWVVLIGIDGYPDYPLRGCVSDTLSMEKYFMGDLQVPRDRIQRLLGSREHTSLEDPSYPSRAHIIGALLGIITNPDITYGDNIVIFYAGHGSYYSDEDLCGTFGYTEALCLIDHSSVSAKGTPAPDISDRELNTILTQIFRAKGHRITVILDCCHSGSVSRELPELGARVTPVTRGVTLEDMLLVGDSYLRSYPGYRSILSRDWYPEVDSHVLLAACKEYEFAKEKEVKGEDGTVGYTGIFTDSLVRALRSGYWRKETTYADIPFGLDVSRHQTPVVSGKYKDTRLWYQG